MPAPFGSPSPGVPRRTTSVEHVPYIVHHSQTFPAPSCGGYHRGHAETQTPHRSQSWHHLPAAGSAAAAALLSGGGTLEHGRCGGKGTSASGDSGVHGVVERDHSVCDAVVVRGANPAAVEAYLRLKAQRGQVVHIVKT